MGADSSKGWCKGATQGISQEGIGHEQNECGFGLKQGNVATFGCNVATFQTGKHPTSRRGIQRRDVPESG